MNRTDLYQEVHFMDEIYLSLFQNSVNLSPQSKEARKYVRELYIYSTVLSMKFTIQSNIYKDLISDLLYLPNIEKLSISPTQDLIQELTDTTEPILTKIKKLTFTFYHENIVYKLADCSNRYRSSLTYLTVDTKFLNVPGFTSEELILYLVLFPCLKHLDINIRYSSVCHTLNFNCILKACPTLIYFGYMGASMNLGRFDYLETQPFPLKSLKLLVTHITVKDAQYINRRLPQLNKLEMNPGSTTEKGNAILGTVLQAKFLDQVRFILPITLGMSPIIRFLHEINNRSNQRNESVINQAHFFIHPDINLVYLYMAYHPNRHLRKAKTCFEFSGGSSKIFEALAKIGEYINNVEICGVESDIQLEDINQYCPVLSNLLLNCLTIAPYDGQLIVNGCLTNLTIESSSIQISMLQKIAICYPKLNNLCFKTNNILTDDENNNDDRVHYIPMNTTSFDIKQSSYHAPKMEYDGHKGCG